MTIAIDAPCGNTFPSFPTPETVFQKTFVELDLTEIHLLALAELAWEEVFATPLPPTSATTEE